MNLARTASKVALGTALSRILGLIRDIMVARYFTPEARDAFIVAFRLPNFFRRIFSEGSLSASLVPALVVSLPEPQRARLLLNSFFTIFSAFVFVLTSLGLISMRSILSVLLAGSAYQNVPGKFELTVHFARIMFGFVAFISLYAYFNSILASFRRFTVAAFAPCLFNLTMIAAAFVHPFGWQSEETLSWAVLVGGFFQMLVLIPALKNEGVSLRWQIPVWTPELKRVIKGILPGLFGVSLMQLTMIANIYFASYLPQGSHTYFYLADRLLELPLALFVISVGSTLLPLLSSHWVSGRRKEMRALINHALRLTTILSLPAAVGLFILALPITKLLFLGKEFTLSDAFRTAEVIRAYAFLLISAPAVRILAQGFYAIRDVWFPAWAALGALLMHLLAAVVLTRALGLEGLALASLISSVGNLALLIWGHGHKVERLDWRQLSQSLLRSSPGLALLGLGCLGYLSLRSETAHSWLLLLWITASSIVYFVSGWLLRVPEVRELFSASLTLRQ